MSIQSTKAVSPSTQADYSSVANAATTQLHAASNAAGAGSTVKTSGTGSNSLATVKQATIPGA